MLGLGNLLERSRRRTAQQGAPLDLEGWVRGNRVRRLREALEDLRAASGELLVAYGPLWPVGAGQNESFSCRGRKRRTQGQRIVCLGTAVVADDYRARLWTVVHSRKATAAEHR